MNGAGTMDAGRVDDNPYAAPKAELGTGLPTGPEGPLAARRRAGLEMEGALRFLGGTMVVASGIVGVGALIAFLQTGHWGPAMVAVFFVAGAVLGFQLERLRGPALWGALAWFAVTTLAVLPLSMDHDEIKWKQLGLMLLGPALVTALLASPRAREVCTAEHRALVAATPEIKARPSIAFGVGLLLTSALAIGAGFYVR